MRNLIFIIVLLIVAININAQVPAIDFNGGFEGSRIPLQEALQIDKNVLSIETYYGRKILTKHILGNRKNTVRDILSKNEIFTSRGPSISTNEIEYFDFQRPLPIGGQGKVPAIGY